MFKDCKNLNSIDFQVPMMAYTYPGVFDGCTSLTTAKLPQQLLFITDDMFKNCI